jgi:nucleoside-diphosphate-sugar epimerase
MPTGPLNRVADNRLARELLGWQPKVPFREGLKRTVDWYFAEKNQAEVETVLGQMLTGR